ncbi:MAG: hypothetical protein RDU25_01535 [Patescibacteria group bacterium]|nr:hypothetical protein [Patescibacteria group bacterium]
MNKKILSVIAIALPLSLMGFGCNPFQKAQDKLTEKAAEKMTEGLLGKATGGKVDVDTDSGEVQFKDNKTGDVFGFGENVKVPDDFPQEVLLYPDAKPNSVITSRKEHTANITLTSTDDAGKIAEWYEEKYTGDGWEEENSSTINNLEYREYIKGNKKVVVSIWPNESEETKSTMITLGYREEEVETPTEE